MGDRDLIISQIRQRLEILYQMVEELENQPGPTPPGPGGTTDYNDLTNKPQIGGTTLSGNKTAAQLGLATASGLSSIVSRFEDLITPDNIEVEDNQQLPLSISSRLTLHQPIMLNHTLYYCYDETGVDYEYFAVDISGIYPKLSYAQIFKENNRVHFYDYETDTVPASASNNFITSGGVYSAIQSLATVARTGSYTDLINRPEIPDVSDYYTKTETDTEISDAIGDLSLVARTGDYDDLENKPTIPAAQVNSDWNAASGIAQILNKPTLGAAASKNVDSSPTASSTNLVESGGVASALNGKQNSLTTAQLNAVNSGITSSKVSQYDKDSAVLPELVNGGAKNLSPTSSGTNGSARYAEVAITLPAGTYVVYFGNLTSDDTDATTCGIGFFANGSRVSTPTTSAIGRGNGVYITLTVSSTTDSLRVYASDTSAHAANDTMSFTGLMICTKEAWDISQSYVPYTPTLQEFGTWEEYECFYPAGGGSYFDSNASSVKVKVNRALKHCVADISLTAIASIDTSTNAFNFGTLSAITNNTEIRPKSTARIMVVSKADNYSAVISKASSNATLSIFVSSGTIASGTTLSAQISWDFA